MFQPNPEVFANLKSQFVTSSWGGIRTAPYAFTEQDDAMHAGGDSEKYLELVPFNPFINKTRRTGLCFLRRRSAPEHRHPAPH